LLETFGAVALLHRGYHHRSLNPKKLIEVGFSHLGARMTMARTIKLYKAWGLGASKSDESQLDWYPP
jgi:hypothetical protein